MFGSIPRLVLVTALAIGSLTFADDVANASPVPSHNSTLAPRAATSVASGAIGGLLTAVDGEGRITVAFAKDGGIYAVTSGPEGRSWGTPTLLGQGETVSGLSATVSGATQVAWTSGSAGQVALRQAGASAWSTVGVTGGWPAVVGVSDDTAVVAWAAGGSVWGATASKAGLSTPIVLASGVSDWRLLGDGIGEAVLFTDGQMASARVFRSDRWSAAANVCACGLYSATSGGAHQYVLPMQGGGLAVYDTSAGTVRTAPSARTESFAMGGGQLFTAWARTGDKEAAVLVAEVDLTTGKPGAERVLATYNLDPGFPDAPWVRHSLGRPEITVDGSGTPTAAWGFGRWTKADSFEPKAAAADPRRVDHNEYIQAELYYSTDFGAPREATSLDAVSIASLRAGAGGTGALAWLEPAANGSQLMVESFGSKEAASCLLIPPDGGPIEGLDATPASRASSATRSEIRFGVLTAAGCLQQKRPGVWVHNHERVRLNGIDIIAVPGTVEFRTTPPQVVFEPKGTYVLRLEGVDLAAFTLTTADKPVVWSGISSSGTFNIMHALKSAAKTPTYGRFMNLPLLPDAGVQLEFGYDSTLGGYTKVSGTVSFTLPSFMLVSGKPSSSRAPSARVMTELVNQAPPAPPVVGRGLPKPGRNRACTPADAEKGPIKQGKANLWCVPNLAGVFQWVERPLTARRGQSCSPAMLGTTFEVSGSPLQCLRSGKGFTWQSPPRTSPVKVDDRCTAAQEGDVSGVRDDKGRGAVGRCVKGKWRPSSQVFVTASAMATNAFGLARQQASVLVPEITVGPVTFLGVNLSYTAGVGTGKNRVPSELSFDGGVPLGAWPRLPGLKESTGKLSFKLLDGQFHSLGLTWEGMLMHPNGLTLTRIGMSFSRESAASGTGGAFTVGAGIGPVFSWFGQDLQVLSGDLTVTVTDSLPAKAFADGSLRKAQPAAILLTGGAKMLGAPLANAQVKMELSDTWPRSITRVEFEGVAEFSPLGAIFGWSGASLSGKVYGWYQPAAGATPRRFQVQGYLTLLGDPYTGLISDRGWVVCGPTGSGYLRLAGAPAVTTLETGCSVDLAASYAASS